MCLITPFKDKKVVTQDMIVYKALHLGPSVKKIITEKKRFGLKTTKTIEVPSFTSEHMSYKYIVGELQPKVEMVTNNEYRASTELEWIRVRKYAEEHFGFCGDENLWWNGGICNFIKEHEEFICVSEGYHSYADLETAKEAAREGSMSHGLVKCIIPAGSEYYEGFGFLVSDQIIVTGERITE